jgi:glycosyltransferase involved in cell wall biosynthesis
MISCIIPVYNNEDTILHVLDTLKYCKRVEEIVVVDDCSKDHSAEILSQIDGIKLILNAHNLGKGGAVVTGIRHANGEVLLLCDADLAKLQPHHIDNLITEYQADSYDMVIAGRENSQGIGVVMARVSGERILLRRTIEPFLDMIAERGNGVEQIINYAHKDKKVKLIASKNIGHVLKYQKYGLFGSIPGYAREIRHIIHTSFYIRRSIISQRLLRRGRSTAI